MALTNPTVIGNIGTEPELRYTNQGTPVLSVSIGATPRTKNDQTGQWEDYGSSQWYRVTFWNEQAEAYAQILHKGQRVIVTGRQLLFKTFSNQDGREFINYELSSPTLGIVPTVEHNQQPGGSRQAQQQSAPQRKQPPSQGQGQWSNSPDPNDPWVIDQPSQAPTQSQGQFGWGQADDQDPPF